MVVLLFGVSLMVFLISHLVPSNPVAANLSQTAINDPEVVAAFEAKWGLDKPLYEQYFIYLKNLLHGDLGTSIRTGQPVMQDLMRYFPATLELSVWAMRYRYCIRRAVRRVVGGISKQTSRSDFAGHLGQRGVGAQLLVCPAGFGRSFPAGWDGSRAAGGWIPARWALSGGTGLYVHRRPVFG